MAKKAETGPVFTIGSGALSRLVGRTAAGARGPSWRGDAVELTADGDRLTAWASSGELGVVAWGPARVETPGTVAVSHGDLAALARRVTGDVAFRADGTALAASAEATEAEIRVLPEEARAALPERPPVPEDGARSPVEDLRAAIAAVEAAADGGVGEKPILTAVHLAPADGLLRLTAADGFTCGVAECAVLGAPGWPDGGVAPPVANVRALERLLGDPSGAPEVVWGVGHEGAWLSCAALGPHGSGWLWRSVLIDGSYPDVRAAVFRAEDATTATVSAEALAGAVAAAGAFAYRSERQGRGHALKVTVEVGPDGLAVAGSDATRGRCRRSVPASVEGPAVTFAADAGYLAAALAALGPGPVTLGVEGGNRAIAIRSVGTAGAAWVVMPLVGGSE